MVRPRQPVDLLLVKGNKHLTKSEIETRRSTEIRAPADKIRAPAYLDRECKKEFNKIAKELIALNIMSNLDVDALARFVLARAMYIKITKDLVDRSPITEMELEEDYDGNGPRVVQRASGTYMELLQAQDKLFKQCRQAANDLGLTISSRCRLVIPKKDEPKPKSREEKLFGDSI